MTALRPGGLKLTEEMLRYADLSKESSVLDIGCGNGESLQLIGQQYGCRLFGVEPYKKRRAAAEKLNQQAKISAETAETMRFAAASFDLIIAECTVSLFSDIALAMRNIYQALKPGGSFVLSDVYARLPNNLQAEGLLRHIYTEQQFKDMLAKAGFSQIYCEDCGGILKSMLADLVFEYGREQAYQMIGLERCAVKQLGMGYILIAAKKQQQSGK